MFFFSSYYKAFQQLKAPAFRAPLIKSLVISVLLTVLLCAFLFMGSDTLTDKLTAWVDAKDSWFGTFLGWMVNVMDLVVAGVGFTILYAPLSRIAMSFVLDGLVEQVYESHYPDDEPGERLSLLRSLTSGVRFLGLVVALNIPLALVLVLFPPFGLVAFYLVNGYLFAKENYDIVALRRAGEGEDGQKAWRENRISLVIWGSVTAFLYTVPIVHFVMPALSAASMVHEIRSELE